MVPIAAQQESYAMFFLVSITVVQHARTCGGTRASGPCVRASTPSACAAARQHLVSASEGAWVEGSAHPSGPVSCDEAGPAELAACGADVELARSGAEEERGDCGSLAQPAVVSRATFAAVRSACR